MSVAVQVEIDSRIGLRNFSRRLVVCEDGILVFVRGSRDTEEDG